VIPLEAIARANPAWVDAMYRDFRRDPASIDPRWALVFAGYELARQLGAADGRADDAVAGLVHAYRELGHLVADLDPLGGSPREHPLLRGPDERALDRVVDWAPFRGGARGPLRDLVAALAATYTGTLGVEYLGACDPACREWLETRMEPARNRPALSAEDRRAILERLMAAESFERFLHVRYAGQKRFSLEGGEALIVLLDALIAESARLDVAEMVFGMPHRGRLNVLAHVLRKPYETIFAEFEGLPLPPDVQGDGDVKYHLGWSHDLPVGDGRTIHLSLAPNPSHLEAVDPVVEGLVRAKQAYRADGERRRVVPVLLHGDAAFTGQGVVYETLGLSALPGYTTGGTVHVIVDNQLGFTTAPSEYLFTRYPSDPAHVLHAPVVHVNADDPEAAVQAARLAAGYRQAFGGDVFIHFVCYRRHGHNELDDPSITQPVLYERIRNHPSVVERYEKRLGEAGVLGPDDAARLREARRAALDAARETVRRERPPVRVLAFGGVWRGLGWAGEDWSADTRVPRERLRQVGEALARVPQGFTPHPRVHKLLEERAVRVRRGEPLDWGTVEMLAYGSLLLEGVPVRLSGQDTVRGTFAHRHAALFDAVDGRVWVPLDHVAEGQAPFEVLNSPLSEAGVLGFEYGVSSADPRRLVVWEAQFGDFADGAQVVIDAFIASGESKWQRQSGIVLLLPHGYEGQGPEHSSARLERFLQLCAERNMQVIAPTLPAQLFHALRRQMHRPFRKPLIVMAPKSLLRHPRAVSTLADLAEDTFHPVLDDRADAGQVCRLLLCAGKVFHALDAARAEAGRRDVAIVRVEELYPFPAREVGALLRRYRAATEVCWVQEEPANQGAWTFVRPILGALLAPERRVRYVGRDVAASPATGSYEAHQTEEADVIARALALPGAARRAAGRAPATVERTPASD
jgi:2-oxoglutarate dehydrogenase E1 component